MLYKKSNTSSLSPELFQNPTSEYRAAPFWAWNCKLDKAQLLRQLEQMKEMGFGGAHIHPRTGLDTAYLGDEFMEMVKACCDKAETEQLLTWLYDEDRWSSGPAGGLVTKHKPFRRKRLSLYVENQGWDLPKAEALEAGEPNLLGCYDVTLDGERRDRIVFPPYDAVLEKVPAGRHTVSLTLFGNRCNSFAPVHRVSLRSRHMDPSAWRSKGDDWTYGYNLYPFGILKAPELTVLE